MQIQRETIRIRVRAIMALALFHSITIMDCMSV